MNMGLVVLLLAPFLSLISGPVVGDAIRQMISNEKLLRKLQSKTHRSAYYCVLEELRSLGSQLGIYGEQRPRFMLFF